MTLQTGQRYSLEYRCRDIGYGIEEGNDVFRYDGIQVGKHAFTPTNGGPTIYLFDDEIIDTDLWTEPEGWNEGASSDLTTIIRDEYSQLMFEWNGAHTVNVYRYDGESFRTVDDPSWVGYHNIDVFSVGDFAENEATYEQVLESVSNWLAYNAEEIATMR